MTNKRFFIKRPTKEETLANKQEEKVQRWRLNHLRNGLAKLTPQWWVEGGEIFGLTLLFLTNLFLLYPFFGHEDKTNVFSAPVVPVLANITDTFVPYSYGVRIWLLSFLIFFPISFYFFVREISGRKLIGFLSSFIASLPIGIFLPLRVSLGLYASDGAHMASLTFIPLVCLLLLKFLRKGSFWMGIFSALGTTLVALTSPIGLLVLTIFMMVITFSEMLLGRGRLKALRFLLVLVLTAGFSAFWYNPKFVILTIQSPQGQFIRKTLGNLLPISFFLLPILGVFGFLLFENRSNLQPMFIALFLTVVFCLFFLGAGVTHLFPSRFLPAFGISLAFLLGILFVWIFDFLLFSEKLQKFLDIFKRKMIAFGLIGLVFAIIFLIVILWGKNLWEFEQLQVLGAISPEQIVGLWEIKEQTSQVEGLVGYGISAITVLMVIFLRLWLR